jgi:hypothetical protein
MNIILVNPLGDPLRGNMPTRVVNKLQEPCDIDISRNGKWGNPFVIGRDGNRYQVIAKFKYWVTHQGSHLLEDLESLRGKRLGCYCAPMACHGDIYIELLGE